MLYENVSIEVSKWAINKQAIKNIAKTYFTQSKKIDSNALACALHSSS